MNSGMALRVWCLSHPFSAVELRTAWTMGEGSGYVSQLEFAKESESVPEGVVLRATERAYVGVLTVSVLVDRCGRGRCEVGQLKLLLELSDLGLILML